jgi:hypothetical protein
MGCRQGVRGCTRAVEVRREQLAVVLSGPWSTRRVAEHRGFDAAYVHEHAELGANPPRRRTESAPRVPI